MMRLHARLTMLLFAHSLFNPPARQENLLPSALTISLDRMDGPS